MLDKINIKDKDDLSIVLELQEDLLNLLEEIEHIESVSENLKNSICIKDKEKLKKLLEHKENLYKIRKERLLSFIEFSNNIFEQDLPPF